MALKKLTIVGGGLAGLALGIALCRRSIPVQLLEASAYPRHRVCGEFLSGIHSEELVGLGIEDLFVHAARSRETIWFDGPRAILRATLPEAAYGLSRFQLDSGLAQRFIALGGQLRTGVRGGDDPAEGTVHASGRPQRDSPWIGLKAHFGEFPLCADLEIHLADGGYVGVTRVEGGRVNVSGLFRRKTPLNGGPRMFTQAVAEAGLGQLAARLESAQMDRASLKGVSRFHLGWQIQRGAAVCIGDAAALIPPFTGNGMTMALQSALLAVEPLAHWSRGECGWESVGRAIRQAQSGMFSTRLRWAHAMQKVLFQPLGRRICAALIARQWISFETFYRKLR